MQPLMMRDHFGAWPQIRWYVFDKMILYPMSFKSWGILLTVAAVPTGINTGVSIV